MTELRNTWNLANAAVKTAGDVQTNATDEHTKALAEATYNAAMATRELAKWLERQQQQR